LAEVVVKLVAWVHRAVDLAVVLKVHPFLLRQPVKETLAEQVDPVAVTGGPVVVAELVELVAMEV
jgi:hypothetical protein